MQSLLLVVPPAALLLPYGRRTAGSVGGALDMLFKHYIIDYCDRLAKQCEGPTSVTSQPFVVPFKGRPCPFQRKASWYSFGQRWEKGTRMKDVREECGEARRRIEVRRGIGNTHVMHGGMLEYLIALKNSVFLVM